MEDRSGSLLEEAVRTQWSARDIADAMLEGAALLPPHRGLFRQSSEGEILAACALGCARYVGYARAITSSVVVHIDMYDSYTAAEAELIKMYCNRFGTNLMLDNDIISRDYVIQNVKEMINQEII